MPRADWLAAHHTNENGVFTDMEKREYIYIADFRRLYLPDELQTKKNNNENLRTTRNKTS